MVRVATWNVNSLRSLLHYHPYSQARDDLAPLFDEHLGADIVCLQETKLSLPASLASASSSSSSSSLASAASSSSSIPRHLAMVKGYDAFFSCCKSRGGYSGVATYVRRGVLTPLAVEEGIAGYASTAPAAGPGSKAGTMKRFRDWHLGRGDGADGGDVKRLKLGGAGAEQEQRAGDADEDEDDEDAMAGLLDEIADDQPSQQSQASSLPLSSASATQVDPADAAAEPAPPPTEGNPIGIYGRIPHLAAPSHLRALDSEGRCLITDHGAFLLLNIYFPNSDNPKVSRLNFKMLFYQAVEERVRAFVDAGRRVLLVGDVNTVWQKRDHCDPDGWGRTAGPPTRAVGGRTASSSASSSSSSSSAPSSSAAGSVNPVSLHNFLAHPPRAWLAQFVDPDRGLMRDVFHTLHPRAYRAFTCWNTKLNCRPANYGTRIDYILCDAGVECQSQVEDKETGAGGENSVAGKRATTLEAFEWIEIMTHRNGSDHCPVLGSLSDTHLWSFFSEFVDRNFGTEKHARAPHPYLLAWTGPAPRWEDGESIAVEVDDRGETKGGRMPPPGCACYWKEFVQKHRNIQTFFTAPANPSPSSGPSASSTPPAAAAASTPAASKAGIAAFFAPKSGSSAKAGATSTSAGSGKASARGRGSALPLTAFFASSSTPAASTLAPLASASVSEATLTLAKPSASPIPAPASAAPAAPAALAATSATTTFMASTVSTASTTASTAPTSSSVGASWSSIFKAPPAPNCHHAQPGKRFQVSKKGANQGRFFYACARGEGDDRCGFFAWEK